MAGKGHNPAHYLVESEQAACPFPDVKICSTQIFAVLRGSKTIKEGT